MGIKQIQMDAERLLTKALPRFKEKTLEQMPTQFKKVRNQYVCGDCNHRWRFTDKTPKHCPNCGRKIELVSEFYKQTKYFGNYTTQEQYQVIRCWYARKYSFSNKPPIYQVTEVYRHFMNDKGEFATAHSGRQGLAYYCDGWCNSPLYMRRSMGNGAEYHIAFFPSGRNTFHPWVRRTLGTYTNDLKYCLIDYYRATITNPLIETAHKQGQYRIVDNLLSRYPANPTAIRTAIRHNYKVPNQDWFDYVKQLVELKRDLSNPAIVCPENFHQAHQFTTRRIINIERKKDKERQRQRAIKQNELLQAQKGIYFGFAVTDNDLTIAPLKTTQEFIIEAKTMRHCVLGYIEKESSLILSASINGQRTETIEVDLTKFSIRQARGKFNKPTKHHKRIISTLTPHLTELQQICQEYND